MFRKVIASPVIGIAVTLTVAFSPFSAQAAPWQYHQESEALTDKQYSYAVGIRFNYEYNNNFTVSFYCQEGKVWFRMHADTLIAPKGEEFQFSYRVDKREARQLSMRTFSNANQSGYTYENVRRIAKDILGGNSMFVRAVTLDNDYLEAKINLVGSDRAIRKVFSDCGVNMDSTSVTSPKTTYSLNDFTTSFKKLMPAQKEKVLNDLRQIMNRY